MESLGGSCGIDARQDGEMGSEFWFTFPYRPDVAAGAPSGMDDSTRGSNFLRQPGGLNVIVSDAPWARRRNFWMERSQNEMNQQPLRILIIEDSLSIVKITTRLLTTKGHVVESAINGSIGLNRLMEVYDTEDDFDVVLSDLQMPVMDGFECVRRYRAFEEERKSLLLSRSLDFIRKTSSTSSWDYQGTASETETEAVPNKDVLKLLARRSLSRRFLGFRDNMAIVGMSANSDSQSATEAIEAGMNIFITKPFTGADLQNILILFDSD